MENDINEPDKFKETFRRKLEDPYLPSKRDSDLWNQLKAELEESEPASYKLNHFWIGIAAALLLTVTVTISLLIKTGRPPQNEELTYNKPEDQFIILNPISPLEEAKEVKTETEKSRANPEKINVNDSVSPSFNLDLFEKVKPVVADHLIENFSLPDGSLLSIKEKTLLKIGPSFKTQRSILLEKGEAFFEVKSIKDKPFIVYFSDYKLMVVGTKFNIKNEEAIKEVTVEEGLVKVYGTNQSDGILLKKGEQLKLEKNQKFIVKSVDVAKAMAWKTGTLDFKNSSLQEVATKLEKEFKKDIILTNGLKDCKFTGDLSKLSEEEALEVIKMTLNVSIEKNNGSIYIKGTHCD